MRHIRPLDVCKPERGKAQGSLDRAKRQQAKAAARYGLSAGANPRSRIERPRLAVASSSRGGLRAKLAADLPMKTDRDGRSVNDMWARPDGNVRPPAGRSKTAKGRTPRAPSGSSESDQATQALDRMCLEVVPR